MKQRFNIGETALLQGLPEAKIVGIDRYELYSHSGKHKRWISYTLESDAGGLYKRFWITDEPTGLFCWTPLAALPENLGELNLDESGICSLDAEGDSLNDSSYSSVLFYESGDLFYCSEIFQGSADVFYMQAKKIIKI